MRYSGKRDANRFRDRRQSVIGVANEIVFLRRNASQIGRHKAGGDSPSENQGRRSEFEM
jgi:hypothetical protein